MKRFQKIKKGSNLGMCTFLSRNIRITLSGWVILTLLSASATLQAQAQETLTLPTAKVGKSVLVIVEPKVDEAKLKPYREIIAKGPGSAAALDAQMTIGKICLEEKAYSVALREFKKLPQFSSDDPKKEELQYYIIQCLSFTKQDQEALENAQKHLAEYPSGEYTGEVRDLICQAYFNTGKFNETLTTFQLLNGGVSKSPFREKTVLLVAKANGYLKNYQEGIVLLEKFVSDYPHSALQNEALIERARQRLRLTDLDRAIEDYRSALVTSDDKDEQSLIQYEIAALYFQKGDLRKTIEEYQRVLDLYPSEIYSPAASFQIGLSLFELNEYQKSIEQFKKTEQVFPSYQSKDRLYFFTGQALLGLGKKEEAKEFFRRVVNEYPTSSLKQAAEKLLAGS